MTVFGRSFTVWYDRHERMWTILEHNGSGDQVGNATYAQSRDWALVYVGMLASGRCDPS